MISTVHTAYVKTRAVPMLSTFQTDMDSSEFSFYAEVVRPYCRLGKGKRIQYTRYSAS